MAIITTNITIINFTNRIIINKITAIVNTITETTVIKITNAANFTLKIIITVSIIITTVVIEIGTCHFLTTPFSSYYYCLIIQNSGRFYPSSPLRLKCGIG